MNDIKSVRDDNEYDDSNIKSVPKQMFIPKKQLSSPMIYYNSLSTERMVENGETKYDTRVETVYDGKKGRVVVDINDNHIEKDFDIKDLERFMNQSSSSSSIEDLQKKYGITKKSKKAIKAKKTNKAKKTKKTNKARKSKKTNKAKKSNKTNKSK